MAFSAHKNKKELEEFEISIEELEKQAEQLAKLIKRAKCFVVSTGAGISTSAGIADFRGPTGVWTLQAQGKEDMIKSTPMLSAYPTITHMALVALEKAGYLKFLISQNVDGLHRKSGFPPHKMAELHGNTCVEYCKICHKEYLRDFDCRRDSNSVHDHRTGRLCQCRNELYDSIINFGENLPRKALEQGFDFSTKADLHVVLGSSLRVTPAADMPRATAEQGRKLVICNLQTTPLDSNCYLRIFSRIDQLMICVMKYLQLPIPDWFLNRRLSISIFPNISSSSPSPSSLPSFKYSIQGIEPDSTPATFIRHIIFRNSIRQLRSVRDPFVVCLGLESPLLIQLRFMRHYNEPDLSLSLNVSNFSSIIHTNNNNSDTNNTTALFELLVDLKFDPREGIWTIEPIDESAKQSIQQISNDQFNTIFPSIQEQVVVPTQSTNNSSFNCSDTLQNLLSLLSISKN
eukprot:TRINITY_DN2354_c2_g1_i1.p1 TRINITY_DN2354_c2_g1~~TRINITY_DN2354_c2_g1_i1.p1  ORF type:complete len:459 (+),score=216.86 TRINITY_DN2354_c2_g1_i1:118-1494(+)